MFSNLVDELLRFQGCFVPDVVVQESIIDDISVVGIQELLYLTAWILSPTTTSIGINLLNLTNGSWSRGAREDRNVKIGESRRDKE